jgi:hypothetical protein
MDYLAIGTDATAEAPTQTGLLAEVLSRVVATKTLVTTTVADDTVQYVGQIANASSQKVIREIGLFNAATVGTAFCRLLISATTLDVADKIELTLKTKYAAGA